MPHQQLSEKWKHTVQKFFGFESKDHRADVPDNIREASHSLANETFKLRSQLATADRREDVLRELVGAMQHKLHHRRH